MLQAADPRTPDYHKLLKKVKADKVLQALEKLRAKLEKKGVI